MMEVSDERSDTSWKRVHAVATPSMASTAEPTEELFLTSFRDVNGTGCENGLHCRVVVKRSGGPGLEALKSEELWCRLLR